MSGTINGDDVTSCAKQLGNPRREGASVAPQRRHEYDGRGLGVIGRVYLEMDVAGRAVDERVHHLAQQCFELSHFQLC